MNLCLNALDAMPEGGRLVVETGNVVLGGAELAGHPQRRPGEFVRLGVRDTGHGIPPEVQGRVFEPFFTTKGRGTGLGLAVVADIARQHHGWVECHSAANAGARFDLYLPRCGPSPGPAAKPITGGAPADRARVADGVS
jgi:signal transduction histidine kinase